MNEAIKSTMKSTGWVGGGGGGGGGGVLRNRWALVIAADELMNADWVDSFGEMLIRLLNSTAAPWRVLIAVKVILFLLLLLPPPPPFPLLLLLLLLLLLFLLLVLVSFSKWKGSRRWRRGKSLLTFSPSPLWILLAGIWWMDVHFDRLTFVLMKCHQSWWCWWVQLEINRMRSSVGE